MLDKYFFLTLSYFTNQSKKSAWNYNFDTNDTVEFFLNYKDT